jgi:hypothetical protein
VVLELLGGIVFGRMAGMVMVVRMGGSVDI